MGDDGPRDEADRDVLAVRRVGRGGVTPLEDRPNRLGALGGGTG